MENLKAKLKNSKGFTLVEMLIVVAIIAILIAISIPMINATLEKSRHSVDQANLRNAVSLGTIELLTRGDDVFKKADGSYDTSVAFYYIIDDEADHQGKLEKDAGGASAPTGAVTPKCQCTAGTSDALKITLTRAGNKVSANWKYSTDFNNATTT